MEGSNHACRICSRKFSSSAALGGHMTRHRPDNSRRNHTCRFCNRNFSSKSSLRGHMNGHRRERDNEKYEEAKARLEQNSWKPSNQHVAPQNYASIPGGVQTQVQNVGGGNSVVGPSLPQAGYPSSLSTYSNQNVGGGNSGVGTSLPTSYLNQQQQDHINSQMRERYPSHHNHQRRETYPSHPNPSPVSTYSNQNVGGGISGVGPSLPQAGYPSSFSTCSYQNEGGGISGVGSSLPTSYLNQQQQDHTNYQQQQQEFAQNPGDLLYYQTIIRGVQTHVELSSPSQVQAWPQAGCSSSLSTYSNHNVGGGVSGVGASLPTSYLNQQQQDHINYQMRENVGGGISGVGPSLLTSYLNQQQQDHINYQMRERYPSRPNHQLKEIYTSLPYQRNNNLQIGGGVSFVNNSGISGPSLPMNSHLQIRGPSFPTFQGGNPNLVVGGYAAASASEQQQQFLSVDPSQQAIHQHWPRLLQPSAPSSATHENDELIPWRREHNS
ncbi:hypothetical protein SUGI_1171030 [Cryptomeria japonica]|uniref:uncharacterized protein LOC131068300 n=1 Tax=Cryptomeria japonica TaxID=3369 RepID=UPI00241494FB|nr:uncharacterized protein LOC131068300 [Cryptomeria japonica]GLJ54526.1 hypothetical protein SUGI_1171030 [Cryptomeria japonica]